MEMKGIVLSGGLGTRLRPATLAVNKQLLNLYDKPMVYYPLSVLIGAGICDILIITNPDMVRLYEKLFSTSKSDWGVNVSVIPEPEPLGIANAFVLAKDFIGTSPVALVLGDNFFYSPKMSEYAKSSRDCILSKGGAQVYLYKVADPRAFGVASLDDSGKVTKIVEKPKEPESNWAVTGLYFYDNSVVKIAEKVQPSARGEKEITSVNNAFVESGKMTYTTLNSGDAWFDTGTFSDMLKCANFVHTMEDELGLSVGSPEVEAFKAGLITREQLCSLAKRFKSTYSQVLLSASLS